MEKYFVIGKIIGTHGLSGRVRVFPLTDDSKRFDLLDEIILKRDNFLEHLSIKDVFYNKKIVILKLNNIDSIEKAETLKNFEIIIPDELALPLKENEYYVRDLIGINVYDEFEESLGILVDIIETNANDVYVIQNIKNQILVPAIKKCILSVDINKKLMIVKLLEGLV